MTRSSTIANRKLFGRGVQKRSICADAESVEPSADNGENFSAPLMTERAAQLGGQIYGK
jgi:hypothetical protein